MASRANHSGAPRIHLRIPTATPGERVATVRNRVTSRAVDYDAIAYVYVVDDARRPVGVVSLAELLRADGNARVDAIMQRRVITAHPTTPTRRVAALAIRHGIKAVPVVNGGGALVGVVGTDAILATLHDAHIEDTLGGAGVRHARMVTDILRTPTRTLVRLRLPWLLVGLGGSMIGALLLRSFAGVLEEAIALAFFIPLIVYMADALGTQTQALYLRGIAIEALPLRTLVPRELLETLAMGGASGALAFMFALVAFHSLAVATTIALALITTMCSASLLALGITVVLARLRWDPALGSGPIATVLQDIVSIAIYFAIASVIIL